MSGTRITYPEPWKPKHSPSAGSSSTHLSKAYRAIPTKDASGDMCYKNGSNCTDYITLVNATARKLKMDRVIPYANSGAAYAANRMPWHLFRWYSRCSRCTGYDPSAACHLRRDVRLTDNHSCKRHRRNIEHSTLVSSTLLRRYPCAE